MSGPDESEGFESMLREGYLEIEADESVAPPHPNPLITGDLTHDADTALERLLHVRGRLLGFHDRARVMGDALLSASLKEMWRDLEIARDVLKRIQEGKR